MITDETIDLTILELARTMRALKALRKIRTANANPEAIYRDQTQMMGGIPANVTSYRYIRETKEHAAVKRASMDLTRMLANLRAGR